MDEHKFLSKTQLDENMNTNNLFLGALLKVAKATGAQLLNMVKIILILFHHNPLFFYTIGLKNF